MGNTDRTVTIEYDNVEFKLLPLLRERVFHVTSLSCFNSIKKEGVLKQNKNGNLGCNFSEFSYGRQKGYVCLFDLRSKTDDEIKNALNCWYFLSPDSLGNKLVFLFPNRKTLSKLIPYEKCFQETGCTYRELCIPYVECWHAGDIEYKNIAETLTVIVTNRPIGGFFSELHE